MEKLTDREREVMRRVLCVEKREVIAAELGISVHTVHFHLRNVRRKLHCQTVFEAAVRLIRGPARFGS